MCDKCRELEANIERYRRIMARLDDPKAIAGIGGLIAEAETAILALHPKQSGRLHQARKTVGEAGG